MNLIDDYFSQYYEQVYMFWSNCSYHGSSLCMSDSEDYLYGYKRIILTRIDLHRLDITYILLWKGKLKE